MGKTKVYYFKKYDIATDEILRSKRPATLRTIEIVFGEPIMETEQEVDESALDSQGFIKKQS